MKKSKMRRCVLAVVTLVLAACTQTYDVVVIGGGAGGTAAAVEAARGGVRTLLVEETAWLGGVLTADGVSAIDGNYNLRGGIFGEFADSLASGAGPHPVLQRSAGRRNPDIRGRFAGSRQGRLR